MSKAFSIEIKDLTVKIEGQCLIDNASLNVENGEFLALLGKSGSGKTTLLRSLAGFIKPKKGSITLQGINVNNIPPENRPISMLFQTPVLFPHLTVEKNAKIGLSKESQIALKEYNIKTLINLFSLSDTKKRKIKKGLSGGEVQRAALLRTFANAKDILLLDEPLKSALNVELRWQLMRSIKLLRNNQKYTTILVTHDFEEASFLADNLAVIVNGKIYKYSAFEMYNNPPNLEIAKVIGPGTEIDIEILFNRNLREVNCPFTWEKNIEPRIPTNADKIYIRPKAVELVKDGYGFFVKDKKFMGEYWLIEIYSKVRRNDKSQQFLISQQAEPVIDVDKEVGARLITNELLYFDSDNVIVNRGDK